MIVSRTTLCSSGAVPTEITVVDQETILQNCWRYNRPGRGGRLDGLVGRRARLPLYGG
jgi:hypothetical protein